MKQCIKCLEWKELDLFNIRKFGPNKKICPRSTCKKCLNQYNIKWRREHPEKSYKWNKSKLLKKKYGITTNDYDRMSQKQKHCCAICKKPGIDFKTGLGVDHDHDTGKVRGLLCVKCNTAIGSLNGIELLRSAIRYFRKHNQ